MSAFPTLKAANDNLVSQTTALRIQLKAANDHHREDAAAIEELRKEMQEVKRVVGRSAARLEKRIEWLERKWSRPRRPGHFGGRRRRGTR